MPCPWLPALALLVSTYIGASALELLLCGVQGGARKLKALWGSSSSSTLSGSADSPPIVAKEEDMDNSMYMVVGFEVAACSIERSPGQTPKDVSCLEFNGDRPPKSQEIKKGRLQPRLPCADM